MTDLHGNIINLPCEPDSNLHGERQAFKRGHKQARHSAAELAAGYSLLEDAAAVMAAPLQMALDMGSISLPGNGVEDLKRGLALYQEWRKTQLQKPGAEV